MQKARLISSCMRSKLVEVMTYPSIYSRARLTAAACDSGGMSTDLKRARDRLMRLLLKRKEGMAPGREEMYDIDDIVVRLAESNLLFDEAKLGGGPWEVWLRVPCPDV